MRRTSRRKGGGSRSCRASDHGQYAGVDVVASQRLLHLFGLQFGHPQVDVGIFVHQLRQESWDEVGRNGGQHAQMECSRERLFLLLRHFFQSPCSHEHAPCPVDDDFPGWSGTYGLFAAVENLHPQLVLQFLNHRAQRGLCHVAIVGCLGKVSEAIDRHHVFHLL